MNMLNELDKPFLNGEFGFAPTYDGKRGFHGRDWGANVTSDEVFGQLYTKWVQETAVHPKCLGLILFTYRDQSPLGRNMAAGYTMSKPGFYGENHAWGIVDVTDTPKWDLVNAIRQANLQAVHRRLETTAVTEEQ